MSAREKTLPKLPLEVASRLLRVRVFYRVEDAGGQLGLTRTQSYVAAREGIIPVERYGKLMLVRRTTWDAEVKALRQKLHPPRRRRARPQAIEAAPEAVA